MFKIYLTSFSETNFCSNKTANKINVTQVHLISLKLNVHLIYLLVVWKCLCPIWNQIKYPAHFQYIFRKNTKFDTKSSHRTLRGRWMHKTLSSAAIKNHKNRYGSNYTTMSYKKRKKKKKERKKETGCFKIARKYWRS